MREANRLTPATVKNEKNPGLYSDGLGLYLQVSKSNSKSGGVTRSWLYRFMRDGVARKMGLGPVHTVSLADARRRAAEARTALLDGVDPIDARKARRGAAKLDAAKAMTFRECAEKFIAAKEAGWKNGKHATQWTNTLATYAYPVIGDLLVSAIDTGLVLKVIEPIWTSKSETAGRLRGRIESVLDWATVREYRKGENPARLRGHLDKVLPKRSKVRSVKHHDAVPYAELPGFMGELRGQKSISANALEFTILCATRTGETVSAEWSEIDVANKIWTVPAERMKGGREHRVPLSQRALAILAALPREGSFVFPGAKAGKPLSNMAMLELLRGMRGMGATVHGFRSTFRDWAAECTNYQNHIVEMALAHVIGDKVEASYRRGDLFNKRARLMADWAAYSAAPAGKARNVVAMRAAK
jgi:integrase